MTKQEIIDRFEDAVREHAFMGAQMPESWPELERYYRRSKQALYRLVGLPPIIYDAEEDDV